MPETGNLRWEVENDADGAARLVLSGDIDDHVRMGAVEPPAASKLVVDLSGVRRISSFGVKEWVPFVRGLKARGGSIVFERCPSVMVRQFNMVPSTRAGAVIKSVFLPYFCDDCDDERNDFLLEVSGDEPPFEPPARACPECGAELEFDDVPESYFGFWTQRDELIDED